MLRLFLFSILFCVYASTSVAQDLNYARKTLNTLTSKKLFGRGYTRDGMQKAANYIEKEFKKMGLNPRQQYFSLSVNTFPGMMSLNLNDQKLIPGKDYIVSPSSQGIKAQGTFKKVAPQQYINEENKIVLNITDKLTWSVSAKTGNLTKIEVLKDRLLKNPSTFKVAIENTLNENFKASNVFALVEGTKKSDSVILITAHYDHLGGMGKKTYFPGANDNGSGVTLMLDLARYYAKNPAKYSMLFVAFGAEEAGLVGSKFFVENPPVALSNIKFVFNLDLVGTGEEGATVVNATIHPREFNILQEINNSENLLKKINPRGKAANSDHYYFSENGIPAFFLYTQCGISAYHDVNDQSKTLPFTVYNNLFKLLVKFNSKIMD